MQVVGSDRPRMKDLLDREIHPVLAAYDDAVNAIMRATTVDEVNVAHQKARAMWTTLNGILHEAKPVNEGQS